MIKMLVGGPEYQIKVSGAAFRFEMHGYCGPMPIYKNGSERVLDAKHRFWSVVSLWAQQGQRVENGWAIWDEPVDPPMRTVPREVKQCECGEQMFPVSKNEEWWCPPCSMKQIQKGTRK